MKSNLSKGDRAMNSLNLAKSIKYEKLRGNYVTLLYPLFDKFADSELRKKFRKVFTSVIKLITKKFGKLPQGYDVRTIVYI